MWIFLINIKFVLLKEYNRLFNFEQISNLYFYHFLNILALEQIILTSRKIFISKQSIEIDERERNKSKGNSKSLTRHGFNYTEETSRNFHYGYLPTIFQACRISFPVRNSPRHPRRSWWLANVGISQSSS